MMTMGTPRPTESDDQQPSNPYGLLAAAPDPSSASGIARNDKQYDASFKRSLAAIEHFRRIYLSVQPPDAHDLIAAIGVTRAIADEGRTTIATGVAAAMAADLERPVVLVEVDFQHPGVHTALGLAPTPGICEYLRRECDLSTAVRQVTEHLFILPAGDAGIDAARLVHQLAAADLRGRLNTSGALLVFDLPPVLGSSYGVLASTMAEALIFVVRAGHATENNVKDALSRLQPEAVRSVVLNDARFEPPDWLRR